MLLCLAAESRHYRQTAAVPLQKSTHEGSDVPIYARGPWAHLFHSTHEQHYIFHAIAHASCTSKSGDVSTQRTSKHCRRRRRVTSHRNSQLASSADANTNIAQDYAVRSAAESSNSFAYAMTSSANSLVFTSSSTMQILSHLSRVYSMSFFSFLHVCVHWLLAMSIR